MDIPDAGEEGPVLWMLQSYEVSQLQGCMCRYLTGAAKPWANSLTPEQRSTVILDGVRLQVALLQAFF